MRVFFGKLPNELSERVGMKLKITIHIKSSLPFQKYFLEKATYTPDEPGLDRKQDALLYFSKSAICKEKYWMERAKSFKESCCEHC